MYHIYLASLWIPGTLPLPLELLKPRVKNRKNKSISTTENTTERSLPSGECINSVLFAPKKQQVTTNDHKVDFECLEEEYEDADT